MLETLKLQFDYLEKRYRAEVAQMNQSRIEFIQLKDDIEDSFAKLIELEGEILNFRRVLESLTNANP